VLYYVKLIQNNVPGSKLNSGEKSSWIDLSKLRHLVQYKLIKAREPNSGYEIISSTLNSADQIVAELESDL